MSYFSKRNSYNVEYSGYEEASVNLRSRLLPIMYKYIAVSGGTGSARPYYLTRTAFEFAVGQELPQADIAKVLRTGSFDEVFTIVEIFLDKIRYLTSTRKESAFVEIQKAFQLSGSVYKINLQEAQIELVVDEALASQIKKTEAVLKPYDHAHATFFEAVGNLFGRKAKAGDVVKDIFIAAEAYLKVITNEAQYSNSVKWLEKKCIINSEQKAIMEKLYAFRSNTKGTAHAGSSPEITEKQALWFVDTMAAQLRSVALEAKDVS